MSYSKDRIHKRNEIDPYQDQNYRVEKHQDILKNHFPPLDLTPGAGLYILNDRRKMSDENTITHW